MPPCHLLVFISRLNDLFVKKSTLKTTFSRISYTIVKEKDVKLSYMLPRYVTQPPTP